MGYIPESAFQKFYNLLKRLKNKKINNKKCYYVGMFHERPAKIDDIKLKDGYTCINSFQEKGLDIKGFGCYIGEYKREISHEYALYELMEEINNLLTNHLCPCKRVLIYSGPVMQ